MTNTKVDLIPDISTLTEGICPVCWAKDCIAIARHENDGTSVMGRDGMTQLLILINDITTGKGENEDIELLKDLCTVISEADGCDIAAKAAANVLYSLDKYGDEWDLHCRRKRCTALQCEAYYTIYIDPNECKGCRDCVSAAPEGAIANGEGLISVVMDDSALKSAEFIASCPNGAIKKSGGLIKPKVPEAPVPVGSFGGESGGGRRRRRGG